MPSAGKNPYKGCRVCHRHPVLPPSSPKSQQSGSGSQSVRALQSVSPPQLGKHKFEIIQSQMVSLLHFCNSFCSAREVMTLRIPHEKHPSLDPTSIPMSSHRTQSQTSTLSPPIDGPRHRVAHVLLPPPPHAVGRPLSSDPTHLTVADYFFFCCGHH